MKRDIYRSITDQIVSELEKGVRPWLKRGATRRRCTSDLDRGSKFLSTNATRCRT